MKKQNTITFGFLQPNFIKQKGAEFLISKKASSSATQNKKVDVKTITTEMETATADLRKQLEELEAPYKLRIKSAEETAENLINNYYSQRKELGALLVPFKLMAIEKKPLFEPLVNLICKKISGKLKSQSLCLIILEFKGGEITWSYTLSYNYSGEPIKFKVPDEKWLVEQLGVDFDYKLTWTPYVSNKEKDFIYYEKPDLYAEVMGIVISKSSDDGIRFD